MHPYIYIFDKQIPSFGAMMVIGILIASFLASKQVKKNNLVIEDLIIMITITMLFALVGAKILYIIVTYSYEDIIKMLVARKFDFLVGSGLVFYGGLAAGVFGLWICKKVFSIKVIDYEYALVPVIPLGHAFGRIGCFLAGCCHGKLYDGFACVTYPINAVNGLNSNLSYFPSQLVESFFNFIIFFILIIFIRRKPKVLDTTFLYMILYSILRFFLEFTRGDEVRGSYYGLYTSQWISIGICVLSISLFFTLRLRERKN